jgi:predicted nucleic acid-binding protein
MPFIKQIVNAKMAKLTSSLDTNVLLRLHLNDIPKQRVAVKNLISQAAHQFAATDTVIIELVFALDRYYGLSWSGITEAVNGLMKLRDIHCNRALFEKALPLYIDI